MRVRPFDWLLLLALLAAGGLASVAPLGAQTFTTLYSFSATSALSPTNRDGAHPRAGLILSGSSLYGTAKSGGSSSNGALFAFNLGSSGFTNLHTFAGFLASSHTNADGANPVAALLVSGARLYGATHTGGAFSNGTIFALNLDGSGFTNLHTFTAVSGANATNRDGANPGAGLIISANTLYGTAENGGTGGNGAVFALNTDGSGFTNLHSFTAVNPITGTNRDGANPAAGMILSGNTLFGVAPYGGRSANGTVFALNTNGSAFTNLHDFPAFFGSAYTNAEGANPLGDLILSGSTLYGTTEFGGTNGNGSVFALNTNGSAFRDLYSFTALDAATSTTNSDGANPRAGLSLSGNALTGVAQFGGPAGNGTLFTLNTNGSSFSILHGFTANPSYTNSDGIWPSGLMFAGATLYGTAEYGGATGSGTVFSLALGATNPMPPPLLVPVGYSPTNGFQFLITNVDGTPIAASQQSRVQVYATTNLAMATTNWTVLTNPTVLTNGVLEIQDPDSLKYPGRFYRSVLEP
jgi:uncharacterized repeat protein (TIGR03803 family)